MFFFEKEKDKKTRQLIDAQLRNCLQNEAKYGKSMAIIMSEVENSNQKVIEQVVNRIKQVIKDQNQQPFNKLMAIRLLRDLMASRNRALGNYVVKKILKRLTILAEFDKDSKEKKKGRRIFGKVSPNQEEYSIQFLNTLLLSLKEWGTNGQWPKDVKGPHFALKEAFNNLLLNRVQFPNQQKSNLRTTSQPAKRQQPNKNNQKPGAKIESMINNSHEQVSNLRPSLKQNPKTTIISKELKKHFLDISQTLQTFISIIDNKEQPDFSFLSDLVNEVVNTVKKGDHHVAQLYENPDKNQKLIQQITASFDFSEGLSKQYNKVKRNPNQFETFRYDYIRKSRQLLANLTPILKPEQNQQMIERPKTSLTPPGRIQAARQNEKKQSARSPAVPSKNRYDSTERFHLQLNNLANDHGKQQFRSSSSNRFGSLNGPNAIADKLKQSRKNSQTQKKQVQEYSGSLERKSSKDKQKIQSQQKVGSISEIKPKQDHHLDSKKVVKDSFQSPSASKLDRNNQFSSFDMVKNQPVDNEEFAGFGDLTAQNKSQSSSDFFKNIQQKPNQLPTRKQRRPPVQKNQGNEDFFDPSIKSKVDGSSYSGFSKVKPNDESSKQKSHLPSSKDQFEHENRRSSNNFFGESEKNVSNFEKNKSVQPNIFQSVRNQFKNHEPNNQRKKPTSQFDDFSSQKDESKIDIDVEPSQRRKASDNFFSQEFSVPPSKDKKQDKSDNGNPYDSDISKSFKGNPFDDDQNNVREQKTPRSHMEDNDNPFQNDRSKKQVPYEDFQEFIRKSISSIHSGQNNPFSDTTQKEIDEHMKKSMGFQIQRYQEKQEFDIDDFANFGKRSSVKRQNSQKQSIRSGTFFDPYAQKGSGVSRKSKQSLKQSIGFDFRKHNEQPSGFDFDQFGQPASIAQNPPLDRQSQQKSGFDLDQFQEQQSNVFRNSDQFGKEQHQKKQPSFNFDDPGVQKQQSRQSGFDFDAFGPASRSSKNSNKGQEKSEQNFFGSQNKQLNVNLDYSKTEQDNNMPNENQFGTFSISNQLQQATQRKNYYQNEKSISSEHLKSQKSQFDWGNFPEIEKVPPRISEQKNAIKNISQPKEKPSSSQISYSKSSQKNSVNHSVDQHIPQFSNFNENVLGTVAEDGFRKKKMEEKYINRQQQSSEKEVKLEDFMPIQKIGTPWNPIPNFSKKTTLYNISIEDVKRKRQQLDIIKQKYNYEQQIFLSLKKKQAKFKDQYLQELNIINEVRTEKQEYEAILNKLKENNDVKESEINTLNSRFKRAEDIRNQILSKQKQLFQKMKNQTARSPVKKPTQTRKSAYKWEIFNRNLENFRNNTLTMSNATRSYYA